MEAMFSAPLNISRSNGQSSQYMSDRIANSEISDTQTWTPKQRCDQVLASSKRHLIIIILPPYLFPWNKSVKIKTRYLKALLLFD